MATRCVEAPWPTLPRHRTVAFRASWSAQESVDYGENPAVILDGAGTLHLFYCDDHNEHTIGIKEMRWPAGGGMSFYSVDSTLREAVATPTFFNGNLQVFYNEQATGTIRGATLVNGSWTNRTTIDGAAGSACGSQGTTDGLEGPFAAVNWGSNTSIFYTDWTTGDLRIATEY